MEPADLTTRILIEIRDGMKSMEARINARFDRVDARFNDLEGRTDARFERVEERLDGVVKEHIRLATEIVAVGAKVDVLTERVDSLDERVGGLTTAVTKLGARIDNVITGPLGATVRDHESRIETLESRARTPAR